MEKINATVLIVDDDNDVLISAKLFLKNKISSILVSNHPTELNKLLSSEKIDLILLDMNYRVGFNDGKEGIYWLKHIKEIDSSIVVILMTAYGEIELAVEAIKAGAFDFILKPWANDKLYTTIKAGLTIKKPNEEKELKTAPLKNKNKEKGEFKLIQGKSAQITELFDRLNKVAITDANVLILGENGSGKQLIAKEIHRASDRKDGPFVHVDIGTLSENLFESELFGYKKGAFTDAKEDKQGRIELAENGSIFLDEIGNLSLRLQSKILTLIQDRKFTPLGDTVERRFNARLIFATNAPLHKWVEEGKFRQDLMYRINTVEMHIPSLRERKSDVPEFIDFYLNHYKNKYLKENLTISPEAMDLLINHEWPGNIRELQHTLERGVIMSDGQILKKEDFNLVSGSLNVEKQHDRIDELNLEKIEKLLIEKAMAKHHGNISKAAKELGLTRAALYRRIEKHDI